MNEHDQKNRKRYEELANRARQSSIYTYSSFHSPETAGLAYEAAEEREITMWGGAENTERVVVRFGDPKEIGYEEDFPIHILSTLFPKSGFRPGPPGRPVSKSSGFPP